MQQNQSISTNRPSCRQAGFTLAEVAIVIIVIGLLIGGIFKGMEIVRSTKVSRTVKEVQAIEAAVITFRGIYNNLPGDMEIATNRLPDCDATNFCLDGNGNEIIAGTRGVDSYDWNSKLTAAGQMESFQFWKHLMLSDLVKGYDKTSDPANDARWGITHPESPFGGGFEFYYDGSIGGGIAFSRGHVLRLSGSGIGLPDAVGTPGLTALRPLEAAMIDRKADDGNPGTGTIRANYGETTDECRDGAVYVERQVRENCVLFFRVFD